MARPSTPEKALALLERKARRGPGAVQVEDVLALAPLGDAVAAEALRGLAAEWPRTGRLAAGDGARAVPLGRWADFVCALLEGGCEAVVALARTERERRVDAEDGGPEGGIALGVLEQVRSLEAVRAVLALAADARAELGTRRGLAVRCAGALNALTWFEPRVDVPEPEAAEARALLHALLALDLSAADAGLACWALRGVGDDGSLRLLSALAPLPAPWHDAPSDAVKAIRRRLRGRA